MILITRIETPLGEMTAGATDNGICFLEFGHRGDSLSAYNELTKGAGDRIKYGKNRHIRILKKQLKEYFRGKRREFTLPLVLQGTEFQEQVWKELQKIPYGDTISYSEQAISMNNPQSVRAVAHANGLNKIAIIIPCHRVIGAYGDLTGYGGGLDKKRWLIDHEKKFSGKPVEGTLF